MAKQTKPIHQGKEEEKKKGQAPVAEVVKEMIPDDRPPTVEECGS